VAAAYLIIVDQVQYCCGRRDQYSIVVVNVNFRVAMDTRMDTRSPVKAQSACAAWCSEPDLTLVPEWEKGQLGKTLPKVEKWGESCTDP
jgi:hypothetical protein